VNSCLDKLILAFEKANKLIIITGNAKIVLNFAVAFDLVFVIILILNLTSE